MEHYIQIWQSFKPHLSFNSTLIYSKVVKSKSTYKFQSSKSNCLAQCSDSIASLSSEFMEHSILDNLVPRDLAQFCGLLKFRNRVGTHTLLSNSNIAQCLRVTSTCMANFICQLSDCSKHEKQDLQEIIISIIVQGLSRGKPLQFSKAQERKLPKWKVQISSLSKALMRKV